MTDASDAPEGIARSRAEWLGRLRAGDLDGYLGVMAMDVVWLPPRGAALEGIGALRSWLAPFLAKYRYDFAVSQVRLRVADGWAFERGHYRSVLMPIGEGAPLTHEGQYSLFWRQKSDGQWRIDRYADSTALAPATVADAEDRDRAT